jgi:hypothetical protein
MVKRLVLLSLVMQIGGCCAINLPGLEGIFIVYKSEVSGLPIADLPGVSYATIGIPFGGQARGIMNYIADNKLACMGKALVATYLYVNYRFMTLASLLNGSTCWSQWRSDKTLPRLLELNQADMGQELMVQIQMRYAQADPMQDFSEQCSNFIYDLDQEVAAINSYMNLAKYVSTISGTISSMVGLPKLWLLSFLSIKPLFFIDEALLASLPEKLSRLAYIKGTFFTWLSDYKAQKRHLQNMKMFCTLDFSQ